MKTFLTSLFALGLAAGAGFADTGSGNLQPVAETGKSTSEPVRRETSKARGFKVVDLGAAEVIHVDKNGDGKISFQELLVHDF